MDIFQNRQSADCHFLLGSNPAYFLRAPEFYDGAMAPGPPTANSAPGGGKNVPPPKGRVDQLQIFTLNRED